MTVMQSQTSVGDRQPASCFYQTPSARNHSSQTRKTTIMLRRYGFIQDDVNRDVATRKSEMTLKYNLSFDVSMTDLY